MSLWRDGHDYNRSVQKRLLNLRVSQSNHITYHKSNYAATLKPNNENYKIYPNHTRMSWLLIVEKSPGLMLTLSTADVSTPEKYFEAIIGFRNT